MVFASRKDPGAFMDRLSSARRRILLSCFFVLGIRIIVGVIQAAEIAQKPASDSQLLLGKTAWIVIMGALGVIATIPLALWWYLTPPLIKFLAYVCKTSSRIPRIEIIVSVGWVRTQAWYFIFASFIQSVVLGLAYLTMSLFTHVGVDVILAGDVAMTMSSGLGLAIITFITYNETDYKATDLVHKD